MKFLIPLLCLFGLFFGCKQNAGSAPTPMAAYYVTVKANGEPFVLDQKCFIANVRPGTGNANSPGSGDITASGVAPVYVVISINRAFSGKPETIPIVSGEFIKDQFTRYKAFFNNSGVGTLTVTSINNDMAEGTFSVEMSLNGTGEKMSLTEGKFRAKFY